MVYVISLWTVFIELSYRLHIRPFRNSLPRSMKAGAVFSVNRKGIGFSPLLVIRSSFLSILLIPLTLIVRVFSSEVPATTTSLIFGVINRMALFALGKLSIFS